MVVAGFWWVFSPPPAPKQAVQPAPVEQGDLTLELPATGSIDAVNVVEVGTPISGRIAEIHADFNQEVKAGQLLAVIDESDYRASWVQSVADLEAAKAAVGVATAALEQAKNDAKRAAASADAAKALYDRLILDRQRTQKLLAAGLTSQAEYEKIEAAYQNAKGDLASAEALRAQAEARIQGAQAAIDQARAEVERRAARVAQNKRNLDYCRVVSPVDGVVVSRDVDVGQTVAARLSAPALFHIAEDLTKMYVYTKLDSSDVAKVKPGLTATFTVNAFPNEVYEGKVVEVRINPNPTAPVSRAAPAGQFQRTIQAGMTAGTDTATDLANTGAAAAGAGGPGGSRQSSATPALPGLSTPASTTSAGAPPPEAKRNTVVVYDALIEFSNPDRKLLPGMTAYVTIPLQSVRGKLKVPNAALRFSPNLPEQEKRRLLDAAGVRDTDTLVWVTDGKSYRPVAVKPLLTDFVYTAVESSELKPGMLVGTQPG